MNELIFNKSFQSKICAQILKKYKVPSIIAFCIINKEFVFIDYEGVVKIKSSEKISLEDAFHLGSCTKVITSTLIAKLVDLGLISWYTKVEEIFKDFIDKIHKDYLSVNLIQLLSHTAGVPSLKRIPFRELFMLKEDLDVVKARREIVKNILCRPPVLKPATKAIYSNYGYIIAAHMIETITNKNWEELTKNFIFDVLDMKSAGFGVPPKIWGHKHMFFRCIPVKDDNPLAYAPAGGVYCSMLDWAKFLKIQLEGALGETEFVSKENFSKIFENHFNSGFGLGWVRVEKEWASGCAYMITGSNTMWYTITCIVPVKRAILVVSTNCGGSHAIKAVVEVFKWMIKVFLN